MTRILLQNFLGLFMITICAMGDEVDNANAYIDDLLDNLRNDPIIKKKIEPIQIPNIRERNFEGTNIFVKGLSSLQRDEKCKVTAKEGNTVVIEVHLKAMDIKFNLNYKAKPRHIPLSIRGKAEGKVDKVGIRAVVSVSPFDGVGKLEEFKVKHFGHFRVTKTKGATFAFNWLIRRIANNMLRRSKNIIIQGIEKGVSKLLQEKLSEVKISARRFNRQ